MPDSFQFLQQKLKSNDTIILGISGGPDSMCLYSLILKLKESLNLKIICAHINHNVRPESFEEQKFVENFTIEHNCIFESLTIENYPKANFESYARQIRYQFFHDLIKKYHANILMTAHHGDDLIESILMRLVRGSNINGYGGFKKEIKYQDFTLLRPLIYTTKKEILEYNKNHKIPYCLDKSNENEKYTRNRYRKNILPFLKNENEHVHQKFLKFSEELYSINEFLENMTQNALTLVYNSDKVNLQEINKLDELLKKRVIEFIFQQEYKAEISCINKNHLQKVMDMCTSKKANITLNMPKNRLVIKSYNNLIIKKNIDLKKCNLCLKNSIKLNEKEAFYQLDTCDINKSNFIIRLNSNEIKLPLYIRYRENGDWIEVKNLNGRKKVKDIFIDEKIPIHKRDTWPIVVDSQNTIIWIPGIKKSKFDKNIDEFYDIIYKYVMSEEN